MGAVPESVLVALAQVAGASVLAGVLDAGVDGHGAVLALGRRQRRPGRGLGAAVTRGSPRVPSPLAEAGEAGEVACHVTQSKPKGPWPLVTLQ